MPEHVHLVVSRHRYKVEQAVVLLKGSQPAISAARLHPMAAFPRKKDRLATCWGRGEWKVYLDSEGAVMRAIRYVEENPVKEDVRVAGRSVEEWRVGRTTSV